MQPPLTILRLNGIAGAVSSLASALTILTVVASTSAVAIKSARAAPSAEHFCPEVPISIEGWADDESAVAFTVLGCAVPESEIRGDGYAVDREGGTRPLIAFENKPDGFENWLLRHRARRTYDIGPTPKAGPAGAALETNAGCSWREGTLFCGAGSDRVRLFVNEGGVRKVSAIVKNGPDGVWLAPWWSPSQRSVAWAGSWGPSVRYPQRYFVVLGEGRTQAVEVPVRYESPLDTFRLESEVLGWVGDAFVYRTRKYGGTYYAQDAFIAREGRLEAFREESRTDVDPAGEIGRDARETSKASFASKLKAHPVSPALNARGAGGREVALSVEQKALPWSSGGFAYPGRHGRVHAKVSDARGTIAEWEIETGTEGGIIAPYWRNDGRVLALMDRRWELRFSGLIRLSDGEAITVMVKLFH